MQGLFLGGSVQGSPHEAGADWGVGEFTESLSRRHGTGSGVWAPDPLDRTANRRSRRARLEGSRGCGVESRARGRSRCGLVVVLQTAAVAIAARKRVCQSVWKESWRFGLGRGPRRGSAKSAGGDPPFQALKLRDWPVLGFRQTCRFPPVWRVSQAEFRQGPPKVHHNPTMPAAHTPSPTPTPIPTRTARLAPPQSPPFVVPRLCYHRMQGLMKHTCRHQGLLARTTGAKSFDYPPFQALSNRSINSKSLTNEGSQTRLCR